MMGSGHFRSQTIQEAIEDALANDPLREFFTWWDNVTQQDVNALARRLETAPGEREMQRYFEQYPTVLIQHLGGGHGRWVIPQKKLGLQYVTDFLIADRHSAGYIWTAVELESPKAIMFTKSGDPSARLTHAIRQITDWRIWLERNRDYAARPRGEDGLGLTSISPRLPGLIIIGRESDLVSDTGARRMELADRMNIEIHTYDWLVRSIQGRLNALARLRAGR